VQCVDGVAKRGHAETPGDVRRQGFVEFALVERLGDQAAQGRLRQPGRGRIYRRQRLGQRRAAKHNVIARVDHLRAEEPRAHFAEGAHARAWGQRLRLAAVEMEKTHVQKPALVLDLADQLAPRAIGDVAVDHRAFDLHRSTFMRLGYGNEPGLVLVAQGQMQNQIELAVNAEFCELHRQRRARRARRRLVECGLARPGKAGGNGAHGLMPHASRRAPH
jgi:hypothetical protein